jgi:hypothetical protein
MTESTPRRAFLASPHHATMALLTLGAGFVSGEPLYLLIGATAYVLGWVYLPDMPFFRRWLERRKSAAEELAARSEIADFVKRRDALLASLTPRLRERYHMLGQVCRGIERAAAENESGSDLTTDSRLRKLDELMWMYLRLLSTQQSLEIFLESERREDLPGAVAAGEAELAALNSELDALKTSAAGDTRERLRNSRLERLEVLRKRLARREETEANLALILAEQDRLSEQIKLIRADAVATRNADALSARIDASVAHLNETTKWLSELDEFKDLVGDLPRTERRIGFESGGPPPLPVAAAEPSVRETPRQRGREKAS